MKGPTSCLSEVPCLLSSMGHLSIFGYDLTILFVIQGVFRENCGLFSIFLGETFAFFQAKVWPKIQILLLENICFSRKTFSFLRKKIGLFQANFCLFSLFCEKIRSKSAWISSWFNLEFQNFVGLNAVQCSTQVKSNAVQFSSRVWSNKQVQGNGPPWWCPWLRPSIFKASCDGRWVVTHSLEGSDFHGHHLLSVATNTSYGIRWVSLWHFNFNIWFIPRHQYCSPQMAH